MFEHSSVVPGSLVDVFGWHARPGALTRLTPPWLPVRTVAEAANLRDGTAILRLAGGPRWEARHRPGGFDPPHQFVDELSGSPLESALRWRHTHRFEPADATHTRVIDEVATRVPDAMLRRVFTYRHRQLADDLAAHRRAGAIAARPLRVAVTGSSGLVGTALSAFLTTGGHEVIRLVRRTPHGPGERRWEPLHPDHDLLDDVDAVVHLAGASIAGRFTAAHRRAVRDSRIGPTRRLAEVAARRGRSLTFVSASAIGYYGPDRGDELLTEDSERGEGFLADTVADWERAADPARATGLRVVHVRTGIVQARNGGTLRLMYPLFAAGLGGRLGAGTQWMSWIGIDDLLEVYYRALIDDTLRGPVNAVAPEPARNVDYTAMLGRVMRRPTVLPTPGLGPRLILGADGVRELVEASQRVVATRLAAAHHHYRHPRLEQVLRHQLGRF